jgi:hypothetical protein
MAVQSTRPKGAAASAVTMPKSSAILAAARALRLPVNASTVSLVTAKLNAPIGKATSSW